MILLNRNTLRVMKRDNIIHFIFLFAIFVLNLRKMYNKVKKNAFN